MSRKKRRISPEEQANVLLERGVVVGPGGEHIGKIGQVFLDIDSGQLNWVSVKTGWFGLSESFIPLDQAIITGDEVHVPYDKATIKGARHQLTDGDLTPEDEDELYDYYRLTGGSVTGTDSATSRTATDRGEIAGGGGQPEMIRSQEQLRVSTRQVQAGRARLRKFIVTEQQTITVPVRREQVHLVREPITDANRDQILAGAELAEQVHEVILTEERVVVGKETVPVERISLGTQTVTEQQQVTETVRKEQIDLDDTQVPTRAGDPAKRRR